MKTRDSGERYTAIVGILELIVRNSAGRKVAIKRVKHGSEREWRVDATGVPGPLKLSVTLRRVN